MTTNLVLSCQVIKKMIIFNEMEWNTFLNYEGIMTNYLYSTDSYEAIQCENFSIYFEYISSVRIVKICKDSSYIYMGYETVSKLFELVSLVKHFIEMLKKQHFLNYLIILQKGLQYQNGNLFQNAINLLYSGDTCPSENSALAIELMEIHPDIFEEECLSRI